MPVDLWEQAGHVYLWRYPKSRRIEAGYHLTADLAGCRSVAALFRAMLDGGSAARRTISLTLPTPSVSDATGYGKPVSWEPGRLRIEYEPMRSEMAQSCANDRIIVLAGREWLENLWSGFVEIEIGGGRFPVAIVEAGEATSLWFWRRPDLPRRA